MRIVCGAGFAVWLLVASAAQAATLQVPAQLPTLAEAVAAAAPGDEIQVVGGRHCGARIDKRLTLVGRAGATIVGCAGGPALFDGLRVGFLLLAEAGSRAGADGTRITGFTFDGA